jgi:predicted acyl esterase
MWSTGEPPFGGEVRRAIGLLAVLAGARGGVADAIAQGPRFFYPEPPPSTFRVTKAVRFATSDTLALAMDVYRPAKNSGPAPAVILYSMHWVGEGPPARESNEWARGWARIAAAHGIVAIIADLRAEPGTGNATTPTRALGDDFSRLVAHLTEHAAR